MQNEKKWKRATFSLAPKALEQLELQALQRGMPKSRHIADLIDRYERRRRIAAAALASMQAKEPSAA